MPLIQTVAPATEPVSYDMAKLFSREDFTYDDALYTLLVSAARRYAETFTGRSFITQQWRLTLDAFPGPSLTGVPFGQPYGLPAHAILLEKGPIQSIESIEYTAMDGSTQTMPAADYIADLSGSPARITPRFGKIWPITLPQIGSVRVNYTAGYGDTPDSVPEGIRHWIMVRVNTSINMREEVAILDRGKVDPLPFMDGLLDPYRVVMF